jgi:hypothetical protein
MRLFFKYFFKVAQYIIGPIILLWDKLNPPRGMVRTPGEQQQVDASSNNLVTRDALREESSREELLTGGGKIKVPCLRIADTEGNTTWMYESSDIITYLQERFA